MPKEYKTIREVVGPLVLVEGVSGVKYDELVKIKQSSGDERIGRVLELTRIGRWSSFFVDPRA